jgi:hypothetical protein
MRRPLTKAFRIGLVIFVVSFFLPALTDAAGPLVGWGCALLAFFGLGNENVNFLAVFGGLINPLAVAYIILRIRDRAPLARWFLGIGILAFIPLTWLSLFVMHLRIQIGHIGWIAGLFLIIDWDDLRPSRRSP